MWLHCTLFFNLSYWAIREVVKCIRILKRSSMETARPQRQWMERLKDSFPSSFQASEFVKNLTSSKLLRALNFHCKKMKKLKFWNSILTRDWHLLKHQLFHLSTVEIGSLSTSLKPHFCLTSPLTLHPSLLRNWTFHLWVSWWHILQPAQINVLINIRAQFGI